jgi:putative ABC transport system permease protein
MDTLRQDLRYTLRSLRARPGFTAVAVLTLSLGIGATTAMFSVVRGILLRPLPYPESERMVTVWEASPDEVTSLDGGQMSHANFRDVRAEIPGIESIALVNGANLTVSSEAGAEMVRGGVITPGFFEVFRTPLVRGREFTDLEDRYQGPKVAIVSADYWRDRLGGRDDVLGSSIRIGGASHRIVGVAPPGFHYPADAQIWVPAQNDEEGCGRGCVNRGSVARLAPSATVGSLRPALASLAARLEAEYPVTNTNMAFAVASLHDVAVGDVRPALWILLAAVAMVLLIACANVANLMLVRGQRRLTEIAVRTSLGADGGRILRQLITESGILAVFGGAGGLLLAWWGVGRLLALAPDSIPRIDEVGLDPMTLAFAATLVAFTTLLFGLAPALELSRIDLTSALRRGGRGDVTGGRRSRGRAAIIASEVALSVVLLIGAGLMVRSLVQITRVEPGFDLDGITAFRLSLPSSRYDPEARVAFAQRYIEQLAAVPGVEDVAFMIGPPLSGISIWGGITRTDAPEPDPGEGPTANYRVAGVGALEMLGIPIVAGRSFAATDRRDSEPVVIITQRLADEVFAGVDPIGRKLDIHVTTGYEEEEPRTIVGVAADIRGSALTREPVAETFIPFAQVGAGFPHVLMRGREPAALLEAARRELRALDPELPMIRPGMMQDLVDAQLAQPRFYLILMGLFSGLAVVLAAVGIYSVVAYAVSQRTREIGVRMALGARLPQIIRLVLWQGLRPAVVGIAAGLVVAFWSGNLMRGLLYQVAPEDPLTLMVVPLLLIAVVALACSVPARRASRIPPAIALRTD